MKELVLVKSQKQNLKYFKENGVFKEGVVLRELCNGGGFYFAKTTKFDGYTYYQYKEKLTDNWYNWVNIHKDGSEYKINYKSNYQNMDSYIPIPIPVDISEELI